MTSRSSQPDGQLVGRDFDLGIWDWCKGIFSAEGDHMGESADPHKVELEGRLDSIGWGLLFLLVGVLAIPNGTVEYACAAAVGAAMLGLNLLRVILAVPVRWFTIILGAAFLAGGSGAMAGLHMDVFVLFFVVAGVVTIVGAIVKPGTATAR
jgi:hypothetical protein